MKLLFEKTRKGRQIPNGFRINKSGASFKGEFLEKNDISLDDYIALGLNEDNKLCLYVSNANRESFYKITCSKSSKNYKYYGFHFPKTAKELMSSFVGDYEVIEKKFNHKHNVTEIVLRKKRK